MRGVRLPLSMLVVVVALSVSSGAENTFQVDLSKAKLDALWVRGGSVEPFERSGKPACRWKCTPGAKVGTIGFDDVPRDINAYRTIRFRIRAAEAFPNSCLVLFVGNRKTLTTRIPGPTDRWERVEVSIPDMRASRQFDPTTIDRLHFGIERPEGFTVEICDLEILKGPGGWRRTAREEEAIQKARRFLIEDYETAHGMPRTKATRSQVETIFTEQPRGHALRWRLPEAETNGCVDFAHVPKNLTTYRILRFRARAPAPVVGEFRIRFRSAGGIIESRLPALGPEWETIQISIPDMQMLGKFEPTAVKSFRLACFEIKGGYLDFDDFELEKQAGGWRYTTKERRDMGIDSTAPFYRISNFEGLNAAGRVHTKDSASRICVEKKRGKITGHYLRWIVKPGSNKPSVTFLPVPADIREYRTLRFRVRVDKRPADRLKVCFQGEGGSIRTYLDLTPGRWAELELKLPEMTVDTVYDPEKAGVFRFVYYGKKGFNLDLDDLEIVKGAGGWRLSEDEQVAFIFGKERARKVKKAETEHFHIWTDSSAAEKKFHKSLEEMHSFVCRELGIEAPEGKLSVYIFQNPDLYFDFCERKGWSRAAAKKTSGHAAGSYFATYYQAPGAPTVAHELTHSIVHQTLGTGGGAWFQEGIAVYLEGRWQKRSTAGEFAARIRSDSFVPLPEFMRIPKLVRETDLTGGPRQAGWLYAQAGAFFEFLLRGPYEKSAPERITALSVLNTGDAQVVAEVEKILGHPIEKVEKDWVVWGATPPKPGRKR